jgi:sensor histidine kinase YesM
MILLLDLLVIIFVILVLLAFATQVVIPMIYGTPLFPFFHKSEVAVQVDKAVDELEEVAELERLDALQEQINRRKAQLKKED